MQTRRTLTLTGHSLVTQLKIESKKVLKRPFQNLLFKWPGPGCMKAFKLRNPLVIKEPSVKLGLQEKS